MQPLFEEFSQAPQAGSGLLANALWRGHSPEELQTATFFERAATSAVPLSLSGHVICLEMLKFNGVTGSAQPLLRATFTMFFQDAFGV